MTYTVLKIYAVYPSGRIERLDGTPCGRFTFQQIFNAYVREHPRAEIWESREFPGGSIVEVRTVKARD